MRILVTGMAGFIGFHAALALHRKGHEVMGIDNLNDYYDPALKMARLAELARNGLTRFEKVELSDAPAVNRVFANFQPELVLHLAAQAGVRYSIENPHVYVTSNLVGFINILEACRHNDKPRLVYASSSSVYGVNKKLPFAESDRVDHPISLYAATKKANELMAHTYSHLYGMQTIGLRFFTVYGPWGRPDMAMWLFTRAILAGKPIKVFNQGNMQRDFTYIDDIVQGIEGCLFTPGLANCEILNLGNHQSEKLWDLIHLLEAILGKNCEKNLLPMQDGDVEATYADIAQARAKLGFEPTTKMQVGVPRFVEWYLSHPEFHEM